jgi:hypothetical protein
VVYHFRDQRLRPLCVGPQAPVRTSTTRAHGPPPRSQKTANSAVHTEKVGTVSERSVCMSDANRYQKRPVTKSLYHPSNRHAERCSRGPRQPADATHLVSDGQVRVWGRLYTYRSEVGPCLRGSCVLFGYRANPSSGRPTIPHRLEGVTRRQPCSTVTLRAIPEPPIPRRNPTCLSRQ